MQQKKTSLYIIVLHKTIVFTIYCNSIGIVPIQYFFSEQWSCLDKILYLVLVLYIGIVNTTEFGLILIKSGLIRF